MFVSYNLFCVTGKIGRTAWLGVFALTELDDWVEAERQKIFMQACKDPWAETHHVRPGPPDERKLCLSEITLAFERWKNDEQKPEFSKGLIHREIRKNKDVARLSKSTIRKYLDLFLIK